METVEQKEYREDLLEWCNNIYLSWESMKPRFTKHFDEKSLEDWEDSCRKLMNKLETSDEVNLEDYDEATRLYDQWELLNKESNYEQENVVAEERDMESISVSSDMETISVSSDIDTTKSELVKEIIDGLTFERIELIKMVLNLEVPMDEIRKFCLENNE